MGRESFPKRVLMAFTFVFVFLWCVLFKDLPRMLFQRRKKIENQVVVITGGAMGIGKEVAKRLAVDEKAKVCILDVNEKEGLNTVDEIAREGGTVHFFRCDVSDHEALKSIAEEIREDPKLGPVNICIISAAVLRLGECMELTEKDYKLNNDVNILGHIYTVKAFLPHMIAAEQGHIVSIGSICSWYGEHYGTAYCAAKFACRGFMEALQMEMIAKGYYNKIVLTSIYPYFVRTGFIEELNEPHSTFFDVVPLEKCAREVITAILKEKVSHFIPGGIGLLCLYLKCLTTKSLLPYGRKVFNFSYHPKKKTLDPALRV
ncbi:Epidermal retinol dehydrogenase 2 [Trichostrongylus colubriformis]|uniref:Epidermal retinol dehydrogenase 2 n=1 Tax=Trichostrongylus colubriformis TaxID=6319 RepID=A0AAN8FEF1_TRICO